MGSYFEFEEETLENLIRIQLHKREENGYAPTKKAILSKLINDLAAALGVDKKT